MKEKQSQKKGNEGEAELEKGNKGEAELEKRKQDHPR